MAMFNFRRRIRPLEWLGSSSSVTTSRPARTHRYRPALEPLETREVPTSGSAFAATLIVHSTENLVDFVTNEYATLLGRRPDAQGLNGFVQALANGMSPEAVEAAFVSSPEYIFDQGNTASGFLTGLYRDLLGRTPDVNGFNGWLSMLANGVTVRQVSLLFATSAERQAIIVTQDYLGFLGRVPESGAVTFWVNQLSHGLNRADVASLIVGSNEFFQRQGNTNVNFIIGAFQTVLGRMPQTGEINVFLNIIAQH
jgi:hypothetical protein